MKDFACRRWSLLSAAIGNVRTCGLDDHARWLQHHRGLGQDVSATGKAVTNSADKVKQGLKLPDASEAAEYPSDAGNNTGERDGQPVGDATLSWQGRTSPEVTPRQHGRQACRNGPPRQSRSLHSSINPSWARRCVTARTAMADGSEMRPSGVRPCSASMSAGSRQRPWRAVRGNARSRPAMP